MKIALVHDWLNTKNGGAERVLLRLAELFPNAPVYTLIYNPELFGDLLDADRVRTSYLQKLPDYFKKRSRYLLPLIPNAVESFDFSGYDIVISSSSAFAKNIITKPETLHICYCHTPMRFAWDYWPDYLEEQRVGPLRRTAIRTIMKNIRLWDYTGSARVDAWIANSKTVKQRIRKYYGQDALIIYPPVQVKTDVPQAKQDYYVTLGMLTPYKKLDLAIEAFNVSGRKLVVIGDGSDRARLEELAEDNIEFAGYVDEDEKEALVAGAKGLIFPNEEDFGIAPVEAMALGTPVIGYRKGGLTETVQDGTTGVLFKDQTVKSLNDAVDKLEKLAIDPKELSLQAEKFSPAAFDRNIKRLIKTYVDAK